MCVPQKAHHGFGWSAGKHNIYFYADDGRIAGRNLVWLQKTLTAMVRVFDMVGLQTKLGNTKAMICTLGFIWFQQEAVA